MGIVAYRLLDSHIAAPRLDRGARRQRGSDLPPGSHPLPPRRRLRLASSSLLRRASFASPSPAPMHCSGGDAMSANRFAGAGHLPRRKPQGRLVPSMRAPHLEALAAVVASTRDALAAQAHVAAHKAARSHTP